MMTGHTYVRQNSLVPELQYETKTNQIKGIQIIKLFILFPWLLFTAVVRIRIMSPVIGGLLIILIDQLQSYGQINRTTSVSLMHCGISVSPPPQDECNRSGGKWIIRLRKGLASRFWENIILAMVGEQFMVGEEICGAVVSIRFQVKLLQWWGSVLLTWYTPIEARPHP